MKKENLNCDKINQTNCCRRGSCLPCSTTLTVCEVVKAPVGFVFPEDETKIDASKIAIDTSKVTCQNVLCQTEGKIQCNGQTISCVTDVIQKVLDGIISYSVPVPITSKSCGEQFDGTFSATGNACVENQAVCVECKDQETPCPEPPFCFVSSVEAEFKPQRDICENEGSEVTVGTLTLTFTFRELCKIFGYVTTFNFNTVQKINTITNEVVDIIELDNKEPHNLAISKNGEKVFVAVTGDKPGVLIINALDNTTEFIEVSDTTPIGIAIDPNNEAIVYVTDFDFDNGKVVSINTKNGEMKTFEVAPGPLDIAITPDGKKAYVACFNIARTISVIDLETGGVKSIDDGGPKVSVAITPDGKKAYVAGGEENQGFVVVISTADDSVEKTIFLDKDPARKIAIAPDGLHAYVSNQNNVSVIDTSENIVIEKIIFFGPGGLAFTLDGFSCYVAQPQQFRLGIINTNDLKFRDFSIELGLQNAPSCIAIGAIG